MLRVIEGGGGKDKRSVERARFDRWKTVDNPLYRASRTTRQIAGYDVQIERERFQYVDRERTDTGWRRVVCTIDQIGALSFLEIQPSTCCLSVELWEALDGDSFDKAELGRVIFSHWEWVGPDVSDYGNILELESVSLWAGARVPTQLFDDVLMGVFPKHSIVLARAWPNAEKYLDQMTMREEKRHRRRQRALMRMMTQGALEFEALGGPHGKDGWMWRRRAGLGEVIVRPRYRPGAEPCVDAEA